LTYGWTSRVVRVERPLVIEWESTSGLQNSGEVRFVERVEEDGKVVTEMTLGFGFVAPRLVRGVLRKAERIQAFMEGRILGPTLETFRRVLMEEDLGMDCEEVERVLRALEEVV